jgi:diguanylate cyclase (GGDEF)-like protein
MFISDMPDEKLLKQLKRIESLALLITIFIASLILLSWLSPVVSSALPAVWSQMKANTALAILFAALSLRPFNQASPTTKFIIQLMGASLTLLLSGTALFEHLSNTKTGLDTLIAADSLSPMPGRMSLQSASFLVLTGFLLLIKHNGQGLLGRILDLINITLIGFVFILIAGYIFNAAHLIGQSEYIRTSPQTLVCFILLVVIITSRRAAHGLFSVLIGQGVGSVFARLMLPAALLLTFLVIGVGAELFATNILSLPYAAAFSALALSAILIALVLFLARKINRLDAQLRVISVTDELTNVYNRRGFFLLGEQALKTSRRALEPTSVLFFDINGLKRVNDTLGHDAGSQLIVDVARMLKKTFRANDVIGRLGGDEFGVVVQGNQADLAPALKRLEQAVEEANNSSDRLYQISFSIGAITAELQSEESLEELVNKADELMYENKRQGRKTEPR